MEKFVLNVPKWQGEFVFSKETLIFVGVILLMVVGILFCFWGYKYFGTILFMGVGIAICYGSYLLVEPMTANSAIRMFLTVSLTFLGICLVYFLSIIWGFILDKLRIRTALAKRIYLFAALAGAAVLGLTVYYMIWRDEIVAGAISAVCLVIGVIFQHSKRKKQVRFRSYDDLLKLSRPQFDADGMNAVSMAAESIAMPIVPIPGYGDTEPEVYGPEPEYVEPGIYESEPEYVEPGIYESEPEYEEAEVYGPEPEYVEPGIYESEPEYEEAEVYEPEPEYEEAEVYGAETEHVEPEIYESEPEYVEPEVYESEPEYVEPEVCESEPEYVESTAVDRMAVCGAERMTDAIKPGMERYLAYRRGQMRSDKDKKRNHAKGAALAGSAAFMAVGLGFLITSRVLKGGED